MSISGTDTQVSVSNSQITANEASNVSARRFSFIIAPSLKPLHGPHGIPNVCADIYVRLVCALDLCVLSQGVSGSLSTS